MFTTSSPETPFLVKNVHFAGWHLQSSLRLLSRASQRDDAGCLAIGTSEGKGRDKSFGRSGILIRDNWIRIRQILFLLSTPEFHQLPEMRNMRNVSNILRKIEQIFVISDTKCDHIVDWDTSRGPFSWESCVIRAGNLHIILGHNERPWPRHYRVDCVG